MVRDEIRARFGVPESEAARDLQRRRLRRVLAGAARASRRGCARSTASRPTRSCSCWSAPATSARAWRPRSRRWRDVPQPAHLIVVGREKRLDALRAAGARRSACADRVTFAGPQADVKPYFGAADAFVLPTRLRPVARTRRWRRWPAGCRSSPAPSRGAAELVAGARRRASCAIRATSTALAAHMRALLDPATARAAWAPTRARAMRAADARGDDAEAGAAVQGTARGQRRAPAAARPRAPAPPRDHPPRRRMATRPRRSRTAATPSRLATPAPPPTATGRADAALYFAAFRSPRAARDRAPPPRPMPRDRAPPCR